MKKKNIGRKTERVSVRCTERNKKKLEERAKSFGIDISDYVNSILFPTEKGEIKNLECIQILIALQDIAVTVSKKYRDESVQEEVDQVWEMLKELY